MIISDGSYGFLIPGKLYRVSEYAVTGNYSKRYFENVRLYRVDPPWDISRPGFVFYTIGATDEPNPVVMFVELMHAHVWNYLSETTSYDILIKVLYKGRLAVLARKNIELELAIK
jgi:hypothetical protein